MDQDQIKALFDQQAEGYDTQWVKTAPIRECLHFLLDSLFTDLPDDARILCVGAGTGAEIAHLASQHPGWYFVAVEPSGAMLEECRHKAERGGFADRCTFHEGYVESLPADQRHHAATCFLVSQFIIAAAERIRFFAEIARRLQPGGLLASSDLASDVASPEYAVLLRAWMSMMSTAAVSPEMLERMRHAYANDVGVLPPEKIAALIAAGGFSLPVRFFQAGLIHAWCSRRD